MRARKFFAILHRIVITAILAGSLLCIGVIALAYFAYGSTDLKPHASEVFWISVTTLILAIFYVAKVLKPWDQIK